MHDVSTIIGREEREIVPQAAHGSDHGRIAGQEHGDKASNAAFGQCLVDNVGLGQASLRPRRGLVFDHDRQAGQRGWHHQVDRTSLMGCVSQGNHVAADQRSQLVWPAVDHDATWRNGSTIHLDFG